MEPRRDRRERAARILIAVYALATASTFGTWLVGHWGRRSPDWAELVFTLFNLPVDQTLVSVVVLALLTRALLARKRFGLWAVGFAQLFGMYLGIAVLAGLPTSPYLRSWRHQHALFRFLDIASLPIGAGVLSLLWWMRTAFPARQRRGSWFQALAVGIGGSTLTVGVTTFLVSLVAPGSPTNRWRHVLAVLSRTLGDASAENREDLGSVPLWVPQVASLLLAVTLLAAISVFTASARSSTGWSGEHELTLRRLIRRFGSADSLAYFATRRDKSTVFSPDGRAAVAYRVVHGVSLASGDPIGDPDAWPAALAAWQAEARQYGWLPAAVGASERGARAFASLGLHVLALGDEAVVETDRFTLGRVSMAPLRRAVRRTKADGVSVRLRRQRDVDPAELEVILASARQWREGAERGFSMALDRSGDPADPDILFVTAQVGDRLVGVLSFVPWGRRDLSLDLMRRAPDAPNGTTERMVYELLTSDLGVRRVSLNFVVFRRLYAQAAEVGASVLTRFNTSVLGWFDRFWQLERLYQSTQRYEPEWVPRFLCYGDGLALPQVVAAAAGAEGFLPALRFPDKPKSLSVEHLQELARIDRATDELPLLHARPRSGLADIRLRHRDELRDSGRDPYPAPDFRPDRTLSALAGRPPDGGQVRVVARVRALRDHGGVVFVDLQDEGTIVQVVLDAARLRRENLREFARVVDVGDLVGLAGRWGTSRTGTASVVAESWTMQAKCLQPIPFHGLADPEARLRRRSVDLIVHPDGVARLRQRTAIVRSLRATLDAAGYTEVETPMLQAIHGGASARPFRTHSNAYDSDLSLRIAPELFLKRLVVGGMGPLYEIGRNFRNEGADSTHNPEFTSLEAYRTHADYQDMRELAITLIRAAATAVHGRPVLPGDPTLELDGDWPVVPMIDAVSERLGEQVSLETDIDVMVAHARKAGLHVRPDMGVGTILEELYAELVEPITIQPTFYVDFPQETSPLTRPHRTKAGLVERWDLVVRGMELGTAYTELTDPVDQRQRLTLQSLRAAAGDPEAMELDESFLAALEAGMPPTGGLGLGVDRLAMVITGAPLRSLLTFPFVKPV